MTFRPLPSIPYRGPIISTSHPIPVTPPRAPTPTCKLSPGSSPALKRRPHTRRLQPAPSSDLPSVSEEDEGDLAEDEQPPTVIKSRRRPRPTPLVSSRSYAPSKMPPILEIPDAPITFQNQTTASSEPESFSLSPSTLFARRRSETVLDFPVPPTRTPPPPGRTPPPSRSLSTPATPPRHSPTPSHASFSSSASTDSSQCPETPTPSDNDDEESRSQSAKEREEFVSIEDFAQELEARFPRPFRRSASVISLRSFSTAQFNTQVEPIYALMYPRQAPPVSVVQTPNHVAQNAQTPRKEHLRAPTQKAGRSPLVLSVLDTTHGGSFDVPLVLGSFLSPPSSPSSMNSTDSESDGEGIPTSWSDSEPDDGPLKAALSSSEEEISDDEGPSCALDPVYRNGTHLRRTSSDNSNGRSRPQLPPLRGLWSLQLDRGTPETISMYSMASPGEWKHDRPLPRDSLVPSDVSSSTTPSSYHPRSPSPRKPPTPELRSRFSTSTLASIPEPPTSSSSKHAFFARLTGRTKPPKQERIPFSPTSERPSFTSNPSRGSVRRRAHIPASPAPSAFSFSTQSTSSLYSTDSGSCSCLSDESSGSTGLRRPPIPIELFLRG